MNIWVTVLFSSVVAAVISAVVTAVVAMIKMNAFVQRLEERLDGVTKRLEDLFQSNYSFLIYRIEQLEKLVPITRSQK